jgi:hypothetical protein
MTVQTADAIKDRPVHAVLAENVIHHVTVASPAQLIPRPLGLERVWSIRRFMTLVA